MNLFAQTAGQGQVLGSKASDVISQNITTLPNTGSSTLMAITAGSLIVIAAIYVTARKSTAN